MYIVPRNPFEKRLYKKILPEIVQVKGPDHSSSKVHVLDVVTLVVDHPGVIEGDPLVALVRVGTHGARRIL